MSEPRGRGTWLLVRFLVVAVLACAFVGAVAPAAGAVERRPLRDPGRRLARPRAGDARRAARPARAARRRPRPLQPALGPDRGGRVASRPGRTATPCSRACGARHPRRRRPRRVAALGERGPDAELRARRGVVRRLRARRRHALPLGEAMARSGTSRTRSAGCARRPPRVYVRQLLNPAYARDPRGDPARQGGGRRHGAARFVGRRLAGRLDPRHARAPGRASTPTRTIRTRRAPARRRSPAGAATARRSRWRRSSACSPRSAARSGRSGSG